MSVNEVSLVAVSHAYAVQQLKDSGQNVTLVCDSTFVQVHLLLTKGVWFAILSVVRWSEESRVVYGHLSFPKTEL